MFTTEASLLVPLLLLLLLSCLMLWLYLLDTGLLEVFFATATFEAKEELQMPYRVEGTIRTEKLLRMEVERTYFNRAHTVVREASLDQKELTLWIHIARQAMPMLERMKEVGSPSSSY